MLCLVLHAAHSDSLPFTPQLPPAAPTPQDRLLTRSGHERPKITALLISEPYSRDHKTLL
jgi:hypothetical protein